MSTPDTPKLRTYRSELNGGKRKELRTSEGEWRGMSSSHRQHTKPYKAGTKNIKFTSVLKVMALIVVLVIVGKTLYDGRQDCINHAGSNSILCMD